MLAALPAIAFPASGVDPREGSWTLISAQSSLTPPNRLVVTDVDKTIHVVMSGETRLDFTAKADGHGTAVTGNPAFDQVELHRIGRNQAEVIEKKNGAVVATIREATSKDESALTITTATKGRADQIAVWTRGATPKAPGDPLAGEWMEDLGKTRMKQGMTLKIEPDGNGGVRFAGESSYTARFDGKPHDVKNSRNDDVTLQLVDPHTVDAVYRRDGQASQRDRWVVSSDGLRMTLTSTATLEGGQHMSETLVFRKQ